MADIKFYYFDVRGRGEFIRLILHVAGQTFDETVLPLKSWPEGKAETPYGQVPYIIYNGKKYGQGVAIGTFFARKFGLYGNTEEEGLRETEVIQLCEDLRPTVIGWFFTKDEDKKAELVQKMKDDVFPRFLGFFEALLVDNGSTGFYVGDSVTMADLVIYDILDTVLGIQPEALDAFPNLTKLRSNVGNLPALKEYLANRPKSVI